MISEIQNCSGGCHLYTGATMMTVKKNRPGLEHRIPGGDF